MHGSRLNIRSARTLARWTLAGLASCVPLLAQGHVQVSLVAPETSVQPGRAFVVALRMEHEPRWHSYWLNAGTGYATQLEWVLPAGWSAGEIQWPTPTLIKDAAGIVTGHGYSDTLYLQVPITPPANAKAGENVTLEATASWLMCADHCIPAKQGVSLTLPVLPDAPRTDTQTQAAIAKMPMPHGANGWQVAASQGRTSVTLRVGGPDKLSELHFYSEDEFIQYDGPQNVSSTGRQAALVLPLADDAEIPHRLIGILAYTDASGDYRGLKVDVPFSSAETTAAVAANGSAVGMPPISAGASGSELSVAVLLLAFMGGLVLNLMPCVFPVLGIKVMGFIDQAGSDRRKVTMHGLMFTVGVLLSFWGLATALAVLRSGGAQLGWGFQLQSAPFVFALSVIMLIFGLSLSGVFEFGLRATAVGAELHAKSGYSGSFFTGMLATVVATPCSAPFLAPALGAALALPTGQSFVVFTAIAVGLSAPYLLLSAFPAAVTILPKPGRWMETFKQLMAFPLYATVGYLVWVLAGQTSESGLLAALLGLNVIALAIWLYGRYGGPGWNEGRSRVAIAGALALFAIGSYGGWPRTMQASDVAWEPWRPERIAELQQQGRGIYVDFTARWCATCQTNKRIVFGSQKVRDYFQKHDIALLKADWTNADPRITAELRRWRRSAIPFNLVYPPSAAEAKVLPEILTPSIVLEAFTEKENAS